MKKYILTDAINYLILLEALVWERQEHRGEREILRCSTGGEFGSCRDGRDPELCANCEKMKATATRDAA